MSWQQFPFIIAPSHACRRRERRANSLLRKAHKISKTTWAIRFLIKNDSCLVYTLAHRRD